MLSEFGIGTRVICVESVDDNYRVIGKHGTIVECDNMDYKPGVEFDEDIGGHDLNSTAKYGYGWYCYRNCLEPECEPETFSAPEIPF